MSLARNLNRALTVTTGLQVRRAPHAAKAKAKEGKPAAPAVTKRPAAPYRCPASAELPTERLLREPVFIISSIRSGSTLLRMMMGAHPRLHAPHELHIGRLEVSCDNWHSERAMGELGLRRGDLEHLLWDRVLHRELLRSGKDFVVEKTPANAYMYRRLKDCWPDARFVFLLRHPDSIARSWHESDPEKRPYDTAVTDVLRYMTAVEEARTADPDGFTVRYEDITGDPEHEMRRLCAFLGVDYAPAMLHYGKKTSSELVRGLGDWRDNIRTGTVQPGRSLPDADAVPERLRAVCRAWGYAS
ncbi:sulfotransferase family protein [Streptomyces olivaceus]|uniref:sulfotransferase family protein n=1 Tax=Streptomyces TaxID=1883 RepID=UPI0014137A53|nr:MULTISPECIES: sulfotransferase [Streptomyces]MBZ6205896.1 sulfotransferase [Streptomyces olivaceus]MBZ6293662.1 sulfotransferase [Streptomyces olivaceus]MBZ6304995.1 sulfotransferase [Streptomyces olivaceus]MBZ6317741.1 sulfotransferase [Streptomyces olivaceus]MBZ6328623.1 sulfotransferase [Streptomyces olivaceus]